MESDCCNALPYFSLGFAHGVHLTENGEYVGICGECKEHTEFTETERE